MHVRCLIDEFANIGQIPNFEKLIATIRSREISACSGTALVAPSLHGILAPFENLGWVWAAPCFEPGQVREEAAIRDR